MGVDLFVVIELFIIEGVGADEQSEMTTVPPSALSFSMASSGSG